MPDLHDQERLELDFLRFFYDHADEAMGPASSDIYDDIKESYVARGGVLPDSYEDDSDYDEDDYEDDESNDADG